ncbi:hypothetical protein [Streptomyces melanosporofaciens]|uniref:Uncharacterized protein n=1 Tax=Streptomyces melanosporofaciens TaxID=67327 RepID=A0A1H5AQU6_STRMJ|nr:hypothetical protein [Streptomyces melanosporofaciens]SED43990.1 hypothetical protein SAMN04490356_8454 [Streptomyces melanosporofaciens]
MPLHVPQAPAPALRSVLTALDSPTAVREARTPVLSTLTGPFEPELPLPVHVLDDITTADAPPRTRLTGWRFLIRDGNRTVAAAEAMLTADGWAFSHFSEGPYVSSAELALSQAESLPSAYQPRLLSIPELYMVTLWLHGDLAADGAEGGLGAGDLLVPLAPAPPGIAPHRAHRATDLLPLLTHRLTRAPLLGSPA